MRPSAVHSFSSFLRPYFRLPARVCSVSFRPFRCSLLSPGRRRPRSSSVFFLFLLLISLRFLHHGDVETGSAHQNGSLYEIPGGCCEDDWPKYPIDQTVHVVIDQHISRGFSLSQHHMSLFHVVSEIVPRALTYYSLLIHDPDMKVIVPSSQSLPAVYLAAMGIPPEKILRLDTGKMVTSILTDQTQQLFFRPFWLLGSLMLYTAQADPSS